LARTLYLFAGKDKFYPAYSGKLAALKLLLCDGSFDPSYPVDPKPPVTPDPPKPDPEPEPTCIEGNS